MTSKITLSNMFQYMDKVVVIFFPYNGEEVKVIAKVTAVVSVDDHIQVHLSLPEFDGRQIRFLKATEFTNSIELVPKNWDPNEQCSFVCKSVHY